MVDSGCDSAETRVFHNRRDAGRRLGRWLAELRSEGGTIVLGLPRGGVPVAYEVAAALQARLDVLVVRKLGAPFNSELAVGAVTADAVVYDDQIMAALALDEGDLEPIVTRERAELLRREALYREGRPPLALEGEDVILVDDGIATGSTMRASVDAVRAMDVCRVAVAAPTASSEAVTRLERVADFVAVLSVPEPYVAVGRWYEDFPQLADDEVVALLSEYARR